MCNMISIDPGWKRMGYSLWQDNELVRSNTFGIDRVEGEAWTAYITKGIMEFYDWMSNLLFDNDIDIIVIEQLPPVSTSAGFNSSSQVSLVFMALASVIVAARTSLNCRPKLEYMAAQHWRTQLIGKKTTKPQIRRKVLELFPDILEGKKITEIPFDQIDSIAIGWCYINDNRD
jgi:Holliday junction resolvasome RuvABC endonuclease subunit